MDEREQRMRLAAFAHVERLSRANGGLTGDQINAGFLFESEYIPLVRRQQGIGKVAAMPHLLSLRTAWLKSSSIYDDQAFAHEQISLSDGEITYDFARGGPDHEANRHLYNAWELELPIIYFLAIAQGFYHAFMPVWIVDWRPDDGEYGQVRLAFGLPDGDRPVEAAERRAGLAVAQRSLRRAHFGERVVHAYRQRCAISGEGGGKTAADRRRARQLLSVLDLNGARVESRSPSDGVLLTKLHRAAFEANLIGIDADYRVRASQRLLADVDDSLTAALRDLEGVRIQIPNRPEHHPDRELLDVRFREFLRAD